MLENYINGANKDLEQLIKITKADIKDIKCANHEEIFARTSDKNKLLSSFDTKKTLINDEILALSKNTHADGTPLKLEEIITDDINTKMELMRELLAVLQGLNHTFATQAFAVSEFYTSLMQSIFPHEISAYDGKAKIKQSLLKVEA